MSRLSDRTHMARWLWMLTAGAVLLHGAQTLLGFGGPALEWITHPWAVAAIMALCAAVVAARAVAEPRERLAWGVLAVGTGLYALGQPSSILFTSGGRFGYSFASPENLLWVAIYPAGLVTLALLVRARSRRLRWEHWLDGAVGALSAAALGAIVVFWLFVDPAAVAVRPAHVMSTLGGLVVIGFGLGTYMMLGWRPSRSVRALIIGFGLLIVADIGYLDGLLEGGEFQATWLESFWLLALLTIAAGAVWSPLAPTPHPPHRMLSAYARVSALLALGLTVCQRPHDLGSTLSVSLAGLAIVAVLVRLSFTLRARARLISALATSEAHLARVQQLAGVGSWEWNGIDNRVSASDEQLRMHGWTRPELPSFQENMQLVHESDRCKVIDAMHDAWRHQRTFALDYHLADPDNPRIMHLQGWPLRDAGGRVVGLLGTSQDVTERFRCAEAERANHAKSEFLSRMSHELRTPLNAVLGFGQLLSTSKLSDRQRANVDQILTAGTHLMSLINEVLEISRIEAGQMTVSVEPVALGGLLDDAIAMIEPLAGERRITVINHQTRDAPWVHADQQRLKQVLLNLLANAVKYNRDGGRVDVCVTPAPSGRVRVAITDTGPGMTHEEVTRAFQPFERLGAELRGVEGTGLGLAVTAGLLDAMGADIDVESAPGQGSTFAIDLEAAEPVELSDDATDEPYPTSEVAAVHTVLCIEDNPSNLNLIAQILERRPSINLLSTMHGVEGVELARTHRPELVLLDLNLPDIGGEQELERLRDNPATAGIPIAILTAHGRPEQRELLLDGGAHAYLTKPIDVAELLELVDKTLLETSAR